MLGDTDEFIRVVEGRNVSADDRISIFNYGGDVIYIIEVAGWLLAPTGRKVASKTTAVT